MNNRRFFPPAPDRPATPPEPPPDSGRDRLFEALDTLRHEAFALQNGFFKAPPGESARLKRLLAENKAAQAALHDALSALGCIL